MLLWHDRIIGSRIVSLQTGSTLGNLGDPIVDSKNLKIEAFYCNGPLIEYTPSVLYSADIREYGEMGAIVNESTDIMPLDDDLVRLHELIDRKFELLGKKVITESNHKLGKISGYIVETESYFVQKLQVRKSFLKAINETSFLIDRQLIRKITDDAIVVADADIAEKKPSTVMSSIPKETIDNPFRKPLPETMEQEKN
jgi:sporulation protein YlmC with PRC-barrel domain